MQNQRPFLAIVWAAFVVAFSQRKVPIGTKSKFFFRNQSRIRKEAFFLAPFNALTIDLYTRTCLPRQYAESSSSPAAASR